MSTPAPSNRLGIDYRQAATELASPPARIIDVHAHLGGEDAIEIYRDVARLFGVSLTYSMTPLEQVQQPELVEL